jgi:hypothetical protein
MFQNFLWYINSISSNLHMKGKYNAIDRGEVSIAYCTNNIPVPAKVSFSWREQRMLTELEGWKGDAVLLDRTQIELLKSTIRPIVRDNTVRNFRRNTFRGCCRSADEKRYNRTLGNSLHL